MKAFTLFDEAKDLRDCYDDEPVHSDHVTALALQIFDGLQPWHRLDARARELLQCAALLHDIGWSQTPDGRGHHKESARLIRVHEWENLLPAEIPLVAQTARYHRKSLPKPGHSEFEAFSASDRKTVMILGGILRLADALDRTHTQRVTRLHLALEPRTIRIEVRATGSWSEEKAMFEIKRDLLELATKRSIICSGGQ